MKEGTARKRAVGIVATFILMYFFWLLNSGRDELFYLSLGLVCAAFVSLLFEKHFVPLQSPISSTKTFVRFLLYVPWLLWQIVLANWDVAKRAISPSMPIDPKIIAIDSQLKGVLARVTFANSITLTPGTITVDIDDDGTFYVHAIAEEPAQSLLEPVPCEMAARCGHIYGEHGRWHR
ncbi:MAG: Na+/H+ antiporter subunit E [Methermicoccaceae archaeon]